MARFSNGRAMGDAFGLIRKRPLATFVWGLLYLAPVFASFALVLPAMTDIFANIPATDAGDADAVMPDGAIAQMMQLQFSSMLLNLAQLLLMVVVYTAIFRAILRPEEDSAFSLRIGMDELRVAVVGLAIGVGLYAGMLVFILLGAAIAFAAYAAAGGVALAVTIGLLVVGLIVMIGLSLARVSMMAPASLLHRDFAFVEGWRLGTGNLLSLFGLMVLIFVLNLAVQILLIVGALTFMVGTGALASIDLSQTPANVNPFAGLDAWLAANWYWAVLAGLVAAFLYGLLITLTTAPFASACRQLFENQKLLDTDKASPAPAE